MDYNDGKWHGWNGGKCPVHLRSQVEIRYGDAEYNGFIKAKAGDYDWQEFTNGRGICAFRVTKEHREPREFWIDPEYKIITAIYHAGFIHVREVLE